MTYTPAQLQERSLYRRAIEAAIWGIPAVNYDAMYLLAHRAFTRPGHALLVGDRLRPHHTHTLIRDMPWASRSSNTPDLLTDDEGSVDLYFAPAPPEGLESNWVPTSKDGQFEVLCRFYGPEKSFFDKTWRLPDVERVH